MLNHTPDQAIIINPVDGVVEKKFLVADGLRELAFSRDYTKAYVANQVDVSNRLTVLDTWTYLEEEVIEVDGVPQGIGVFPDNRKLAVILGSKTDFMAGGFDVIDLYEQSRADPRKKKRLYRERDLSLTHKIAVGNDGDRVYCVDAKQPLINIYSFAQKRRVGEVDLHGAPEELHYPHAGRYYYVSVLAHNAIYQISKATDEIEAVYVSHLRDLSSQFNLGGRLRYMTTDSQAKHLIATNFEAKTVSIWDIGNPQYSLPWQDVPYDPSDEKTYRFELTHYLPKQFFRLKGGYNPNLAYTPGGKQIAVGPSDRYLFIVDDEGALYIYELGNIYRATSIAQEVSAAGTPIPEPVKIVSEIEGEMRDLKVSQPPLPGGTAPDEGRR